MSIAEATAVSSETPTEHPGWEDALADVWRVLRLSVPFVYVSGLLLLLSVGARLKEHAGVVVRGVNPLAPLHSVLLAPFVRWDSTWYLSIAQHFYSQRQQSAFYPLYPLLIRAVAVLDPSYVAAGILVSLISYATALVLLHRLVTLELDASHARRAVLILAVFPTAFFFSAVYSESLMLALTVGCVLAARNEQWWLAGLLGGLAAVTRNTGAIVGVTVLLMYLYGPRSDQYSIPPRSWWFPRYRLRPQVLWLLLIGVGALAYPAWLGIAHGDALQFAHVQGPFWHRQFEPLGGLFRAPSRILSSLKTIVSAKPQALYPAVNGPLRLAGANLLDLAFFVFALVATVGVARHLPTAYVVYCVLTLLLLLSAPKPTEPLLSTPRFVAVMFPLAIWAAIWTGKRRDRMLLWVCCSSVALGLLSGIFASGRWVA